MSIPGYVTLPEYSLAKTRNYDSTLDVVIVAGVVLEKGNAAPVAGLISIFRTVSFGTGEPGN